ncbi:Uncharacterised protein [Mycobacterium tuberculosis]|nr:Uncharacterised protein [Mycobacterium tuberculosis]
MLDADPQERFELAGVLVPIQRGLQPNERFPHLQGRVREPRPDRLGHLVAVADGAVTGFQVGYRHQVVETCWCGGHG